MLTVQVDAYQAITRLDSMNDKIQGELVKESYVLTAMMRTYIIQDKLSGQLVNHISGKLWQSMYEMPPQASSSGVTAGVGQSAALAPYGPILEHGGQTRAHDIFPKEANALHFYIGSKEVFAKVVHHPGSKFTARNYMSGSLQDKQQDIIDRYTAAFMRGAA